MLKNILTTGILLLALTTSAVCRDVVIAAGTELSVSALKTINSKDIHVGDEANFTLAADVAGVSSTIAKGAELYGRVVDVKPFDDETGSARVVIMFDFLKVGEEFYSVSALFIKMDNAGASLEFVESKDFPGATSLELKGSEIVIENGSGFTLKVLNDVTND